jgi:hypothetical protein
VDSPFPHFPSILAAAMTWDSDFGTGYDDEMIAHLDLTTIV